MSHRQFLPADDTQLLALRYFKVALLCHDSRTRKATLAAPMINLPHSAILIGAGMVAQYECNIQSLSNVQAEWMSLQGPIGRDRACCFISAREIKPGLEPVDNLGSALV